MDLPEPAVKGMYYWEHYVKREHFDVVPQPAEWEEGRLIIEGVDFTLENEYSREKGSHVIAQPIQPTTKEERNSKKYWETIRDNLAFNEYGDDCENEDAFKRGFDAAMKEERKFTLDEMLVYGARSAVLGRDMNPIEYFKKHFNIDLSIYE